MWNYRIIQKQHNGGCYHEITEVYYKDGVPVAWVHDTNFQPLRHETIEELKDTYDKIKLAFEKPVLREVNGKLEEVTDGIHDDNHISE